MLPQPSRRLIKSISQQSSSLPSGQGVTISRRTSRASQSSSTLSKSSDDGGNAQGKETNTASPRETQFHDVVGDDDDEGHDDGGELEEKRCLNQCKTISCSLASA